MLNLRISLTKTLVATGLSALGLLAAGCTQSQRATLMGEGFNDEFSKTGQSLRPDGGSSQHLDGLSTKSQQIERDLRVD
jgi:hypothetical protein